jgi:hypothetical protein
VVIVGTRSTACCGLRGVRIQDLSPLIPLWLMLLWALLATTLRHCLPGAPALVAGQPARGSGRPLSYYGGGQLAGVRFGYGEVPTLIGLACSGPCCFRHAMARRLSH